MGEVATFEQQRFAKGLCERIGKAIAKIQLCRMPTASPKVPVCSSCNLRLINSDRFDRNIRLFHELIKPSRRDGVFAGINYNS